MYRKEHRKGGRNRAGEAAALWDQEPPPQQVVMMSISSEAGLLVQHG